VPGEGRKLPRVRGLVKAEHDEAETRVVAPLVEKDPQAARPIGRYGDVSPCVRPEPPVHRSVVVAEAARVQLHHQPVLDAHCGHLDQHVGCEPGGVLSAGTSRHGTGEDSLRIRL
jgi:hypothetical protein